MQLNLWAVKSVPCSRTSKLQPFKYSVIYMLKNYVYISSKIP